ncbi:uncharacterized protein [Clytia hemisphaerica]
MKVLMENNGSGDENNGSKRKRFTMIQRSSPTIRREESMEEYSPGEYNHDTSPPQQIAYESMSSKETMHAQPPIKKSRGRPTKQYWTHEWSDHATEALIELWGEKEELYNKQHPLFYVKENKDKAVEEIRDSLRERGFDVTCNNILSKFQSLRTYFCTQRTKHMATRRANGMSYLPDDGSECKWRFYKSLMFLDDNMKPRESHRKMELINAEYSAPSFTSSNDLMTMRSHSYPNHHHQQPPVEYINPHDQSLEMNGYHGGSTSSSSSTNHVNKSHDLSFEENQGPPSGGRDYTVTSSYQEAAASSTSDKRLSSSTSGSYGNTHNKHEDYIFGELVGNMVHQLPAGKHKDLVKLEIQQLIIKAKYASKNNEEDETEIKSELNDA